MHKKEIKELIRGQTLYMYACLLHSLGNEGYDLEDI
jgi:hypothetical protein